MVGSRRCFLLVLVFATAVLQAQTTYHVDEAGVKLRLHPQPVLELPVVNASGKLLHGVYKLELLNIQDKVQSTLTGTFDEKPGTTLKKIPWAVDKVDPSPSSLGWLRLHYVLTPEPNTGVPPTEGFLQLSRIIVGSFEVRMAAASTARPGAKFPVRIRVDDPTTNKPLHGVHVKVSLDINTDDDKDDSVFDRTVVTDLSGFVTMWQYERLGLGSIPTQEHTCGFVN